MKKLFILLFAGMFLFGLMAIAQEKAPGKVVKINKHSGEITKIDTQAGTITIKVKDKEHTYKAEAKLLEGLAVGDKVNIEVSGDTLKSIKKVEQKPAEQKK